ncbi:MAG: hypothetical protein ABIJ97_15065, partial [Bacteroidota bacterium]
MNDRLFLNDFYSDSDLFMFPQIPTFEDFFNNDNFLFNDPFFEDFEKLHQEIIEKMRNMQDSLLYLPEKLKDKDVFKESETYSF